MDEKLLNELCEKAARQGKPLLIKGNSAMALSWSEPPRPQASFGLISNWVPVRASLSGLGSMVLIPFLPKQLGWVKQASLQLFRFDTGQKIFEHIETATQHPKQPVLYATISKPGVFGLVGLHTHPLVQETIRLFCQKLSREPDLSPQERRAFQDEICNTILCSGSTEELELTRPAFAGETICDRCQGIDLGQFLDCQVLEPVRKGPCEQAPWENVGPSHISGAMRQILVDPTEHRRLYAVSANGGIWQLNNVEQYPDQTWQPLTDSDDVNSRRFRTMAVAPSDGRTLYAANSVKVLRGSRDDVYSEIYRSSDRGQRWTMIHTAGMGVVHRIVVHPANAEIVCVASSKGLWRKISSGEWQQLTDKDCLDVEFDPDDASIVYLGVRGVGIFKSFTSGADWSAAPILAYQADRAGSREVIKIALGRFDGQKKQTRTSRTVVVRFGNEICVNQRSGEGGDAAWERFQPFLPNSEDSSKNDAIGFLQGGGSARSDTDPAISSEWCNCLALDPFDPTHILTGSQSLLESKDGGKSWIRVSSAHEDEHSLAFDEETRNLVYLANDGGLFSSIDGGQTWPTMSLGDTERSSSRGLNLARGLITSEFRHSAIRNGRCVAAIDHTGFVLSENFDKRWQFLFNGPDFSARHGQEQSYVFACPASPDRYYIIDRQDTSEPNPNLDRVVQVDFTRTDGLVDRPTYQLLSETRVTFPTIGTYFPEEQVYLRHLRGPFDARFKDNERLLLFATEKEPEVGYTIQSLRLPRNGTTATKRTEAISRNSPFTAITFVPHHADIAYAITRMGMLFMRDFSQSDGMFSFLKQWEIPNIDRFVSRLAVVTRPQLILYAITHSRIGRFDEAQDWETVYVWPNEDESILSIAAHPSRDETLFLGTNKGVYYSEDCGSSWTKYRQGMPAIPITELAFDQGYLYASTLGRGLWRCTPC